MTLLEDVIAANLTYEAVAPFLIGWFDCLRGQSDGDQTYIARAQQPQFATSYIADICVAVLDLAKYNGKAMCKGLMDAYVPAVRQQLAIAHQCRSATRPLHSDSLQ